MNVPGNVNPLLPMQQDGWQPAGEPLSPIAKKAQKGPPK
jgi:hypothetical protein